MASSQEFSLEKENFHASRLLVIGTGSIGVAFLPYWLNWLRLNHPDVSTKIVLTRSAQTFATETAISSIADGQVYSDQWPEEPTGKALHVELAEWMEAAVVFPCTLHYLSRLANGLADSPSLLALQCSNAPIGLAPSLPPGGVESQVFRMHMTTLAKRKNIVVCSPEIARSITTGRDEVSGAAQFPSLLDSVQNLRSELMNTTDVL